MIPYSKRKRYSNDEVTGSASTRTPSGTGSTNGRIPTGTGSGSGSGRTPTGTGRWLGRIPTGTGSGSGSGSGRTPTGTVGNTGRVYSVTARPNDKKMGSVKVTVMSLPQESPVNTVSKVERYSNAMATPTEKGGYKYGTVLQLEAKSNEGYRFVRWNDGVTSPVRILRVTATASYEAIFSKKKTALPVIGGNYDPNGQEDVIEDVGDIPGTGGAGTQEREDLSPVDGAGGKLGVVDMLKKWWWAVAILALMLYDMKGGK